MATKEQRLGKKEPPREAQGFLQRLNDFGERHAKAIITVSALLLVATVALFAKVFYDRTLPERAAREIREAGDSIEKLRELKMKYKGTAVEAEIVYRLANRYHEENRLEDAKREYEDFRSRFQDHPLAPQVSDAYSTLVKNTRFWEEERAFRLKMRTLLSHPEDLREPEGQERLRAVVRSLSPEDQKGLELAAIFYGPEKLDNPIVEFEIEGKLPFTAELFENDAPNTVYNFMKLIEQKAFDPERWWQTRSGVRALFMETVGLVVAAWETRKDEPAPATSPPSTFVPQAAAPAAVF